ncbi:LysR family transcriptional regulator [Paramixta manurensis]|uniref:LysR family transcriptional regulator n=1 Tax=Paramixta manurensis TaxID=2740817 RepID=A0A6M8UE89_9GAMM|nr:LysR family transcriptional regulator [Erwiniaceae bacterium PD-1]
MSLRQTKLPRLNAIAAFSIAAEAGSLAKAATQLALTPAAVSQQIRQLEEQLGTVLFLRTQTGVRLTEEGKAYLRYVREAFGLLQRAQQNLQPQSTRPQLTLYSLPALATKWLTPAIGAWQRQHPDCDLTLHATHARVDFSSTPADFALCFGDHHYPQLERMPLFHDEVLAVCSPSLLGESTDPADYPLIHLDWGNDGRFLPGWQEWFQMKGETAPLALKGLTFNLTSLAIDAALQGCGMLLGQRRLIQRELAEGRLVAIDEQVLPLSKPYFVVWPKRTLNKPAGREMLAWLQALAQ